MLSGAALGLAFGAAFPPAASAQTGEAGCFQTADAADGPLSISGIDLELGPLPSSQVEALRDTTLVLGRTPQAVTAPERGLVRESLQLEDVGRRVRAPFTRGAIEALCAQLAARLAEPSGAHPELAAFAAREGRGNRLRVALAAPGREALPAVGAAQALPPSYPINSLELLYAEAHPDHPPLDELAALEVPLTRAGAVLQPPARGATSRAIRLSELGRTGIPLSEDALREVERRIVQALRARGLAAVLVRPHPDDIDPETRRDRRPAGQKQLRLQIWTGRVEGLRSFARSAQTGAAGGSATSRYPAIEAHSPLQGPSASRIGDLLRLPAVEAYVARLNRHPGRTVDAVISPALSPTGVYLNYRVASSKPWSAYVGTANSGTRATEHYRQSFGFAHYQATGRDDVLRLEYRTNGFQGVRAGSASYEAFWPGSERVRWRVSAAEASFDLRSDDAFALHARGRQWHAGVQVISNLWQSGRAFADLLLGLRFQRVIASQESSELRASANFILPSAGARLEWRSDAAQLLVSLNYERNLRDQRTQPHTERGIGANVLDGLGRYAPDPRWQVLRGQAYFSTYLEPLLGRGTDTPLRHEASLRLYGQHSLGGRLVPQEQALAGGARTVRGYARRASGDSMIGGTLEYAIHLTRLLAPRTPIWLPIVGEFWLTPRVPGGRLGWDLALHLFADAARVTSERATLYEQSQSLLSVGAGVELRLRRNLWIRLDLGVPLRSGRLVRPGRPGEGRTSPRLAERGHPRLHLDVTMQY